MKKQLYTRMVNFTVTDEQHAQLQQEAERLGVSVSELIRAMLFRKRRPRGVALGGFERQEPKALL
jgi:antitoxin component of RelBE/YafQ-DinJ toxin-antitoxin module